VSGRVLQHHERRRLLVSPNRKRTHFSLDSEVRIIQAIVKESGLESFILWGQAPGAQAIAYAVNYTDRVSHLILSGAQARWHPVPAWTGVTRKTLSALALSNGRMAQLSMAELSWVYDPTTHG
jgi:hypothetical protein